jgi:RNA polymerase sigma-70 factor, ECF subfamily
LLALDGDSAVCKAALTLIAQQLRGFFSRGMQSMPLEVEDLVQETLMAIHVNRATYDAHYAVTSWVLAIGKYRIVDFWCRHERTDSLHDDIEQTDSSELMADLPEPSKRHDLIS